MSLTLSDQEQELLQRGVLETIDRRSLETKVRRGRPLRVKFGIDPTGYQVHLGHVVALRKLRAFQDAGHQAILIIGDYTAQVGDPSGRDKTRSALSHDQTRKFAAGYLDQIQHILNLKKTEVHYNSEWFGEFSAADFLRLMTTVSANNLLAHETFRQRLAKGLSLGLHEMMYPLLQGYDSVAVRADVELGGADQKFSLLTGRDVQTAYHQDQQDIMLFDYLLGTDGKVKMSKTANNYIAIEDAPGEMYGKVMSIPDKQILPYFTLATDESEDVLAEISKTIRSKKGNPRDLKVRLAKAIVTLYHGAQAADTAETEFRATFRKGGVPSTMPTISVRSGQHQLINVLISHQLVASRSEGRRLIEQGGVKIDKQPVTDWETPITVRDGMILQIGKRRFVKLTLTS